MELRNVHFAAAPFRAVVNACERDRLEAGFGKECEAVAGGPVARPPGQLGMPRVTRFQAFAEDLLEFRRQRIDMANARRARGHVLLGVFLKLDEIEIITAVRHSRGLRERRRRTGEHRQTGRQGQRLLRAGQQHVDAQSVERNFRRREGADGIDDKHHVGIFFLEGRNLGEGTHRAGPGLVVDQGQGIELA